MEPQDTMTLSDAAKVVGMAYPSLAEAVREGRLKAWKSGKTWLTTRAYLKDAVDKGTLRPRRAGALFG